jgi:hypothetical protein
MQFPEAVGMMEVRMGLHMGPLYTGVLGIKLPRYCLFGTTQVSLTQSEGYTRRVMQMKTLDDNIQLIL